MDPSFSSSDIESDDEPKLNPHSHRGAASIKLFETDSMQKRIARKKTVKNLSLVQGFTSGLQAAQYEMWKNRYLSFEISVLGHE